MRLRRAVPLFLVAIALAACSSDLPTTSDLISPESAPLLAVEGESGLLDVGICKSWLGETPAPAIDWRFEWTATSAPTSGSTTIRAFESGARCVELADWPEGTNVTVTEVIPEGFFLESILLSPRVIGAPGTLISDTDPPSVTFSINEVRKVWFKNDRLDSPPPPVGGQGCTPGFWRQLHHFEHWVGYDPDDLYSAVFGVIRAGTLLENVTARGGGENALARHSVAALLNASSPFVDYDLSVADVIAAVQAAFATGNFEATKDHFEGLNEQGCPL